MEGVLSKWTNYVSGWQQRWFTLNDGILSYYRSKEEMASGCRGSVKLSVCDVIIHSTDTRRFDLLLDEQRFYLRACSHTDRQRWVVALGNCKVRASSLNPLEIPVQRIQSEAIQRRQSELQLYHRLLVEQVKALQAELRPDSVPDMTSISDITGNLNAACSTYLSTLDELHSLAQRLPFTKQPPLASSDWSPRLNHITRSDSPSMTPRSLSKNGRAGSLNSWFPSNCGSSASVVGPGLSPARRLNTSHHISRSKRSYRTFFSSMDFSFEDLRPNFDLQTMRRSNRQVENMNLPGDFLSAWDFAKACRGLFTIFDNLADIISPPSSLEQVKADVIGNLERLELTVQVYAISKKDSPTLPSQSPSMRPDHTVVSIGAIIRNDVTTGRVRDDASSYQAVLWLCRSLNFVREFLHLVFTSSPPENHEADDHTEDSLNGAATEAYTRCLRPFHPWTVRGVVMILIKSLPKRSQLIQLLSDNHSPTELQDPAEASEFVPTSPSIEDLKNDANAYGESIGRTLTLIEGLFASLDLERVFTGSESY